MNKVYSKCRNDLWWIAYRVNAGCNTIELESVRNVHDSIMAALLVMDS